MISLNKLKNLQDKEKKFYKIGSMIFSNLLRINVKISSCLWRSAEEFLLEKLQMRRDLSQRKEKKEFKKRNKASCVFKNILLKFKMQLINLREN